jgi:hypothetical protein
MIDASKIAIQIASEFTGSKAFKQAETATEKLQRSVKNLGRTLGVTLSLAAIVNFGKASVRAFMDAEREGAVLANTMKNLGLAFETSRISAYIDNLGKLYGVTGDQAVPAMLALLSATGSVTKSQELMNTAMNVAAANNISVSEAAKGLSQAYLGNRKALNQYNTGLTKAELQLKSFEDLQKLLDTRLAGAATEAAATYSGQLLILKENAEQAKEAIGKGLIDSFILLAGDNSLEVATDNMKKFGDQIAYALLGAADLLKKLQDIGKQDPSEQGFVGPDGIRRTRRPSALEELSDRGKRVALENRVLGAPGAISGKFPGGAAYFAAQKKADDAAIKRAKELQAIERKRLDNIKKIAAEKAKKLALDKLSAFLNKAQQMFDIDRIQLAAAELSKQTEEDKLRIRLKKEILDLEEAINDGNINAAVKLAGAISQDAKLLSQLRGDMISLGDVPNPFLEWLSTLEQMLAMLKSIKTTTYTLDEQRAIIRGMLDKAAPSISALQNALGMSASGSNAPENAGGINPPNYGALSVPFNAGSFRLGEERSMRELQNQPTYVTVNVAGSISTERDIVTAITQGIYNNQAAGTPINYSTVY